MHYFYLLGTRRTKIKHSEVYAQYKITLTWSIYSKVMNVLYMVYRE